MEFDSGDTACVFDFKGTRVIGIFAPTRIRSSRMEENCEKVCRSHDFFLDWYILCVC